jgi:O-antigen/teichoic acid export membrane protein
MSSNTARIAKNTLALYFRQILIMLVSLYTVRVVLNTLGAEDYGIYNVVSGVVAMFGFLSNSMATASQRYFSFELGRGNYEQLKRLFSLNLMIYVLITLLVLLLAETIGIWFVGNKLSIQPERKTAALWVYQTSIISFLFTVLTVPYLALIMAHEDMSIYAYISIIEAALKLGMVFLLRFILMDKLQLYGILMCIVMAANTALYRTICAVKYQECKFKWHWNKELFKEIAAYTGWNVLGVMSNVLKNHSISILLNQFFNAAASAACGIALSVNGMVSSFSINFTMSMHPQIVKHYASGQQKKMMSILFSGTKAVWFLMYIFTLPLVFEMPLILSLWLKKLPDYTVLFTRLALIDILIGMISRTLGSAVHATGKVKTYQAITGGIIILNFPVAWIALFFGTPAYSVMIVRIALTFISVIAQLLIVKYSISLSIFLFIKKVIFPLCLASLLAAILPAAAFTLMIQGVPRLCAVTGISVISVCVCVYVFCLDSAERIRIKNMISAKMQRVIHQ